LAEASTNNMFWLQGQARETAVPGRWRQQTADSTASSRVQAPVCGAASWLIQALTKQYNTSKLQASRHMRGPKERYAPLPWFLGIS
jgi:hypothetical protein